MSTLCVDTAYRMVITTEKFDLYDWLKDELMANLTKIKGEKKGTFLYGNLIVCLFLFFIQTIPSIGHKDFAFDLLVGRQIKVELSSEDKDQRIWGFFKDFQKKMRQRMRIPQEIVDKYDKLITFVIMRDETWMEAVTPRTIWVNEMGYEVGAAILESYAQMLINAPKDPNIEIFGTVENIASET